MHTYIKKRTLGGYDLSLVAVVGISTLVLVLQRYYPLALGFPRAAELIYCVMVPRAAGWLLFRDKPPDYGFRIGNWKWAIILTPVCLAVMGLILYGASKIPEFRAYYYRYAVDWPGLVLDTALYMFAWEFMFRGYMLFGLEKSIGKNAIFVQAIPFVLLHLGATDLETLVTIPEAFILGYVAYKTRSFLPCFIIHIGIDILMDVLTY